MALKVARKRRSIDKFDAEDACIAWNSKAMRGDYQRLAAVPKRTLNGGIRGSL